MKEAWVVVPSNFFFNKRLCYLKPVHSFFLSFCVTEWDIPFNQAVWWNHSSDLSSSWLWQKGISLRQQNILRQLCLFHLKKMAEVCGFRTVVSKGSTFYPCWTESCSCRPNGVHGPLSLAFSYRRVIGSKHQIELPILLGIPKFPKALCHSSDDPQHTQDPSAVTILQNHQKQS